MKKSKLKLTRQTIANLTHGALTRVKGGHDTGEHTLYDACNGMPSEIVGTKPQACQVNITKLNDGGC